MRLPQLLLAIALSFALNPVRPVRGPTLLAVDVGGEVYRVDAFTGETTYVGYSGFGGTSALARDAGGRIFTATSVGLIELDPITGLGTLIGPIGLNQIRGMSFAADGMLYLITTTLPNYVDILHRYDPATGVTTLVGSTGRSGIQSLTAWGNQLVAWDLFQIGAGLVAIDPATGVATDLNPAVSGAVNVQALATGPDGRILGSRHSLYSIKASPGGSDDRAAGVATAIGPISGIDVRGLAWIGNGR